VLFGGVPAAADAFTPASAGRRIGHDLLG
jgi:hypothetical protein